MSVERFWSRARKWGPVPRETVVCLANMCSDGLEFGGCSKRQVMESVEDAVRSGGDLGGNIYIDVDGFCIVMDAMAAKFMELREHENRVVNQAIGELYEMQKKRDAARKGEG